MPNNDRIQELASAYTLGVLDGDDLKELEDYLRINPEVYKELIKENEAAFSQLAYVLKGSSPNPELRNKLLTDIKADREVHRTEIPIPFWQRLQPIWLGLGSAVAAIIIVSLITYSSSLNNRLKEQQAKTVNLENLLLEKESQLAMLKEEFGSRSHDDCTDDSMKAQSPLFALV